MGDADARHDNLYAWSRRLRDSDRRAFTALFHALYPDVLWYARQRAGTAADDLVQEAFVRLWERREEVDPERSVRALLYVTVRNLALNRTRNAATRRALEATRGRPGAAPCPDDLAAADQLGQRLRAWIDDLPDRQREAFELSRFCGLSHEEIARVMDLSVHTVEKHVTRALRRLRQRLHSFDPDLIQA